MAMPSAEGRCRPIRVSTLLVSPDAKIARIAVAAGKKPPSHAGFSNSISAGNQGCISVLPYYI